LNSVKEKATMPIQVPLEFQCIPYDSTRHPQSAEFDFRKGANCQLWAYALLKHFGVEVPPFRSSELWEDQAFSDVVQEFAPLDLLLFNDTERSWGAHVAVYLGDGVVAHLSRQVGRPEICAVEEMLQNPKYQVLVGAKRIKGRNQSMQSREPQTRVG
jgi:hypothetical protein